eukprot:2453765-Pyramimonas_sp.AAC.1
MSRSGRKSGGRDIFRQMLYARSILLNGPRRRLGSMWISHFAGFQEKCRSEKSRNANIRSPQLFGNVAVARISFNMSLSSVRVLLRCYVWQRVSQIAALLGAF